MYAPFLVTFLITTALPFNTQICAWFSRRLTIPSADVRPNTSDPSHGLVSKVLPDLGANSRLESAARPLFAHPERAGKVARAIVVHTVNAMMRAWKTKPTPITSSTAY